MFPVFRDARLERVFVSNFNADQRVPDLLMGLVYGGIFLGVAKQAWKAEREEAGILALTSAIFCFSVPARMIFNWSEYPEIRSQAIITWVVPSTFFAIQARTMLLDFDSGALGANCSWMLLKRSQILFMFMWAASQAPLVWLGSLAHTMQHVTVVHSPPADAWRASDAGMCTVGVTFLQMTLGFLLPCCISLLLEQRSRLKFLWRHNQLQQAAGLRLVPSELQEGWNCWHLLWQAPMVIMCCWRLAEILAEHYFQL